MMTPQKPNWCLSSLSLTQLTPASSEAEEARLVVDLAHEIQSRVLLAVGRLAKAERIRLGHAVDGHVGLSRIGRVIELFEVVSQTSPSMPGVACAEPELSW